jgi:hypothetical protein
MQNKYLEKIASDKNKDKSKVVSAVGASLLGGFSAGVAGGALQHAVSRKVVSAISASHSDSGADHHTLRKFMKDNGLHKTTTFNTRKHNVDKMTFSKNPLGKIYKHLASNGAPGPAFLRTRGVGAQKDFVVGLRNGGKTVKNADVLMHELGHAKDFQSYGKLKALAPIAKMPGVSSVATIAALSNDKTRDYAPAVAAIPGALTLREEAAANYHAYKGIKAHKGAAAANKYVRKLLPSQMGSYAVGAAIPVAGAYLAKKIMDKWHPKKESK